MLCTMINVTSSYLPFGIHRTLLLDVIQRLLGDLGGRLNSTGLVRPNIESQNLNAVNLY